MFSRLILQSGKLVAQDSEVLHFFLDDVVDFVFPEFLRHQALQAQIKNDGFLFPAYGRPKYLSVFLRFFQPVGSSHGGTRPNLQPRLSN